MDLAADDRDDQLGLDKPVPRRPRTSAKLARLGVRNRRHEYLQRNPAYFANLDHELAGMISSLTSPTPFVISIDCSCRSIRSTERHDKTPLQISLFDLETNRCNAV